VLSQFELAFSVTAGSQGGSDHTHTHRHTALSNTLPTQHMINGKTAKDKHKLKILHSFGFCLCDAVTNTNIPCLFMS